MKLKDKIFILYGISCIVLFLIIYTLSSWIIGIILWDGIVKNIISLVISVFVWFKVIPYWSDLFKIFLNKYIDKY